jgi:membrane fusion protein (multidrug efflux system)
VITVVAAPLALTQDLPGRTSAFHVAEVRARVSGIVEKRLFEEGGEVKQGQVLYQIDPAPYQASLKSAQGTLARAEANVASTRAQEERYRTLLADHAVSKQDYDNAVASFKGYEADVVSGQAGVQTAEINLGYTQVVSPITGRIGISQVTEGAYVQESAATLLATVQQLDPMYVDVTQPSSDLLRLKRELASGKLKSAGAGMARVKLILDDDSEYPVEGTLQLADVTVNQTTSSVTVRAIFPNPKDELLPGMFVRARLEEGISPDAILVPQLAVTHNQQGEPTAMVAGAAGHVELRVLKTPRAVGNQWLVSEGLKPGDLLIVDSLQRLRPGAAVKPVPAKLPPVLASAESPAN